MTRGGFGWSARWTGRITGLGRPRGAWSPGRNPGPQRDPGHAFRREGPGALGRQGNELRWWFCDSGKGIGPAEGAHLFDPFYCGRQAGRGLGLGLSRAARIVALAGGTLRWSSSIGQGTVFQVQLPLTGPPEQPPRGAASHRRDRCQAFPPRNQALCARPPSVGDGMALGAKEAHIERLGIIPVMALESARRRHQTQHLGRAINPRVSPRAAAYRADLVRIRRGRRSSSEISRCLPSRANSARRRFRFCFFMVRGPW